MHSEYAYGFGRFAFHPRAGLTRVDGSRIHVPPKALAVLRVLVERAGTVVQTGDILDALWPDGDVGAANVTQYVSVLRAALDDDPRAPRFIVSEYGRGYRFVAPVHRLPNGASRTDRARPHDARLHEARYLLELRTPTALRAAARSFARILRCDQDDVAAHSGFAEASSTLASYLAENPSAAFARARRHAEECLRIDSSAARAHAVLGHIALFGEQDFEAARCRCELALGLDPHDRLAIRVLGRLAMVSGNLDGATSLLEAELEVSPGSLDALTMLGVVEQYRRRPAQAASMIRRVCGLDPTATLPVYFLATCLLEAGGAPEALKMLKPLATRDPTPAVYSALARAYALVGSPAESRRILAMLAGSERHTYVSPYLMAGIHVAIGEHRAARERLREGRQRRDPWIIFTDVEPRFDALRL